HHLWISHDLHLLGEQLGLRVANAVGLELFDRPDDGSCQASETDLRIDIERALTQLWCESRSAMEIKRFGERFHGVGRDLDPRRRLVAAKTAKVPLGAGGDRGVKIEAWYGSR